MGEVTFNVTVTDNGELSKVQFSIPDSDPVKYDMVKGDDGRYEVVYNFTAPGMYRFYVTAVDEAGNIQEFTELVEIVMV